MREVERWRVRGRGRGEGERRAASPFAPNYAGKAPGNHTKHLCNNIAEVFRVVALSFEQTGNFAAPPKAGVGTQRSAAHKQARRMVARATGRSSPLACAPRAPSRHRRKDPPDASVARRGALPWHERSMGSGQHAVAVSIIAGSTAELVKTQNRGNCIANSIGIPYYSAIYSAVSDERPL